jgi:hypothetical protein
MRSDSTAEAEDYTLFHGNGNSDNDLWTGFLNTCESSAFKRVQFISDTTLLMI